MKNYLNKRQKLCFGDFMKLKKLISFKGLLFLIIFSALAFVSHRLNFASLVGAENQFFTVFQFFGPIAGGFLGPVVGVLAVLIAEVFNFITMGKAWSIINLARLLPMLFAAFYFGTKGRVNLKSRISLIVPIIAIAAFIVHPVGRTIWFFTLFWTIPVIIKILPKKYSGILFLRSLGATFTAHAVGGAAWIWSIPMTGEQWIGLIPIVAVERLLFAAGIAGSYILFNTILDKLSSKVTTEVVDIEKKYVLFKNLFRARV